MKHIIIAALLTAIVPFAAFATPCGEQKQNIHAIQHKSKAVSFLIYKIDFREDLTRVYMRIVGRPHTSFRIDSLQLSTKDGNKYEFTDIDGIDANRYFQWEDSGEIDVEVDFPAIKEQDIIYLSIFSPDGIYKTAGSNPEF